MSGAERNTREKERKKEEKEEESTGWIPLLFFSLPC